MPSSALVKDGCGTHNAWDYYSLDLVSAQGRTAHPQVEISALEPGEYVLRVQALDFAGNADTWTTIATVRSVSLR